MNGMNKIFIVREYLLTDDYGGIRIDEEALFSSYDEAIKFLNSLKEESIDINDNSYALFRIEIVEYELGKVGTYLQKWVYNLKGELIDTLPKLDVSNSGYTGKFNIGDIVYITPKIYNNQSPSIKGTFGVVVEAPCVQNKNSPKIKNGLKNDYTIYFISENGFFNHLHAKESVLSVAEKIPNDLKFLQLYSKHMKQEIILSEDLIKCLLNENIFIKNIRTFDFSDCSINSWGHRTELLSVEEK